MNRSIEVRLRKLEKTRMVLESPPRRSHMVAAPNLEEGDAAIAKLIAEGASPDDLFFRLVPITPDPTCHMHDNYRWEGRWVRKDGRDDKDLARQSAMEAAGHKRH
jgi:hypothetical protein